MPDDEALLTEIKANYSYARDYWREIYDQGAIDVRYQTEGPWEESDLQDRAGRVTLSPDELGQYLNQICNEFRQAPRAVKVNPRGNGANDQTAAKRAALIREIEYQSHAQHAYVTCGEHMVRRGYGYIKLATDFDQGSFNRILKVVRVPNPDVMLLDPDAKEADWADCLFAFETERLREAKFRERFGDTAKITDFDSIDPSLSKDWITSGDAGRQIQVASYWRRRAKKNILYLLENGQTFDPSEDGNQAAKVVKQGKEVILYAPDGAAYRVVDQRDDNRYSVTQYITNGLEILEANPSDFDEIPIIPMFGREEWVPKGGQSKRTLQSAIRMARQAYKAYCYVTSASIERLAMDPKTPWTGFQGQFDTSSFGPGVDPDKTPTKFVEFKAITLPNGQVYATLPQRNLTEPQINQYELSAEAWRRRIQAAMGGSPLPTSAQRQNQKSGVALETIENSNDQGNFHFIDNYDRALERVGRMMDSVLDIVYDTPREVGLRDESGEYSVEQINQTDDTGQPVGFHTSHGDHGVTISTGPSSQSMRDEADKFLDALAQNQMVFPRVADLVVKMKNLGPIGDQIAQRLAPPDSQNVPPEIAGQLQQAQQTIAQLQQELQQAKSGDWIKKYTVDEQEKTKRVLGLIKVDQQDAETRLDQMLGALDQRFQRLSDLHQTLMQQQHERDMATTQQAHQADMAAGQQAHEASQAQAAQEAAQQQAAQPQQD